MRLPDLEQGELVINAFSAHDGDVQTFPRGRVFLTDRRLIFVPHLLDRLLGRQGWEVSLATPGDADDLSSGDVHARFSELVAGFDDAH